MLSNWYAVVESLGLYIVISRYVVSGSPASHMVLRHSFLGLANNRQKRGNCLGEIIAEAEAIVS